MFRTSPTILHSAWLAVLLLATAPSAATALSPHARQSPTAPGASDAAAEAARHIETLVARGLNPLAAKEAKRFLERHPNHAQADRVRYRLAGALASDHQDDAARELYETLSRRDGFELAGESALRLGRLEFDAGRDEQAALALARALELGPAELRPGAAQLLGEVEYRRGRWSEAEAAWDRALREAGEQAELSPVRRTARAGRAWCAFQLQHWDEVVARVEQCAEADAGGALDELWLLAGDAHSRAQRPAEARAAYARVRSKDQAELALRGSAYAALDEGDLAAASAAFTDLLRRHPQGAHAVEAAIQLGALRLRSGDARGAAQLLGSAPLERSAEAQYWRARAERELGRPPQALAAVERALALEPSAELLPRLQALRAELLLAAGRADEARAALAATGSDAGLQAAMAEALNGGNAALAADFARDLLQRYPDSTHRAEAELVLAEELFQRKQYGAALAAFDTLERGSTEAALQQRAALRAAWAAWLSGDRAAAVTRLSALEARCSDAKTLAEVRAARARCQVELAEERMQAGDHGAAAQAWRGAIEADEAAAGRARLGLAWALYQSGDAAAAARELEACLTDPTLEAPQRAEALELRVWMLVKAGSAPAAAAAWREFARADVDPARRAAAARAAASALSAAGDPAAALALLDECLRGLRSAEQALPLLEDSTWAALAAGRLDDAGARARAAVKAAPRDEHTARACRAVADAWLVRKSAAQALQWYELASRADGAERAPALYGLAWCRLEANDARGAAAVLATLLAQPDLGTLAARANYLAGEAASKLSDPTGAAAHYRAALDAGLEAALAARAWLRVAAGELEAGRADAALAALQSRAAVIAAAGQADPSADEAALTRARALLSTERASAGSAELEALASTAPSVWSARAALALSDAAKARGDDDEALSHLIRLIGRWGGEAERSRALYDAGGLFERRGDSAQALQHYQELLDAHPKCALARDAGLRIQALRRAPRTTAEAGTRRR